MNTVVAVIVGVVILTFIAIIIRRINESRGEEDSGKSFFRRFLEACCLHRS